MSSDSITVPRSGWPAVVATFRRFFSDLGDVRLADGEIEFLASTTGLAIRRDGTSRSFMPLHDLEAGWETIAFDFAAGEVKLMGQGTAYTYRVPPQLRR